ESNDNEVRNEHQEGEVFDAAKHRPTRRGFITVGAFGAVLATTLIAAGAIPRAHRQAALEREAKAVEALVPQVQVARVQRTAAGAPVVLPGTVQPLQETAMYARANGYVRKWYVDIGAEVKQGQPLVDLELPDLDEELRQARASAKQASATI